MKEFDESAFSPEMKPMQRGKLHETLGGFIRFCVVGGTVAIFNLGLLAALAGFLSPNASFLIAYPPAVALHFALNKWWTFRCQRNDMPKQLAQYILVAGLNFAINLGLYNAALHWMTSSAVLANAFALPVSMTVGFLLFRHHVFRAAPAQPHRA